MIVFWLLVFVLTLGAAAAIARPVAANRPHESASKAEDPVTAALAGIERDRSANLIDEETAAESIREVRSGGAANSGAVAASAGFDAPAPRLRFAAFLALGAMPLAAVLIYLNVGAPHALRAAPAPATTGPAAAAAEAPAAQRINQLEARLQSAPEDFAGWIELGDEYLVADRSADAERAFRRAIEINPDDASARSGLGEALVLQSNGAVTAEARAAFDEAVRLSPTDPRARFFVGEAQYQAGAVDEAVRAWAALLNDAPADAQWFSFVAARLNDAATEAGIALEGLGLRDAAMQRLRRANGSTPARGPTAEQVRAISALPEAEQRRMIEGMVTGLAERLSREPNDAQGWRMLARSYRVLGRPTESAGAWRELLQRVDGEPDDWRGLVVALLDQRPEGVTIVDGELLSALEKLSSFYPDDPLVLYNLGFAARDRGDAKEALALWTRLRDISPPNSPLAPSLERLIGEVRGSAQSDKRESLSTPP